MADDRSIAPGPSRWRRAWEAGLRPYARWLLPAVVCGALAAALDGGPPAWGGLDVRPAADPVAWWGSLARGLALGWGLAGLVVVASALGLGRLGWISVAARRRLGAAPASPPVFGAPLVSLLAAAGLAAWSVGVVAGAARAVDATEAGLAGLWWAWATRGALALALAFSLAAAGELLLDRWRRHHRLLRSRQQVRDEARAAGAR